MILSSLRINKRYSNYCPICRKRYKKFNDFGIPPRKKVLCPECGSLERHRLQWMYLKDCTDLFDLKGFSLLHIAPEMFFYDRLNSCENINYTGIDFDPAQRGLEGKIDQGDILNLPYNGNMFNGIICNHVLEHIPDDIKAMSEVYRVLKPNGFAILQVPMSNQEITVEDLSITDPEERLRRYGQRDHVRIYGKDYRQRLASVGFNVVVDDYIHRKFSILDINNYGLMKKEDIYIVRK